MIIASVLLVGGRYNTPTSRVEIEKKARSYGMEYPSDFKVINKKDVGK